MLPFERLFLVTCSSRVYFKSSILATHMARHLCLFIVIQLYLVSLRIPFSLDDQTPKERKKEQKSEFYISLLRIVQLAIGLPVFFHRLFQAGVLKPNTITMTNHNRRKRPMNQSKYESNSCSCNKHQAWH